MGHTIINCGICFKISTKHSFGVMHHHRSKTEMFRWNILQFFKHISKYKTVIYNIVNIFNGNLHKLEIIFISLSLNRICFPVT